MLMCGIGGFKGKNLVKKAPTLLKQLAEALVYRGDHATGVGYVGKNDLQILKAPISPTKIDYNTLLSFVEDGINGDTVIFHNRFATNGSVKDNKNNHPFQGSNFLLAHNGVLRNYIGVASKEKVAISKDEPETDSYVLVRLIDKYVSDGCSFIEAIKKACLCFKDSSLCLEILAKDDDLYLVRGDVYSIDLYQINDEFIWASSSNYTSPSYYRGSSSNSLQDIIVRSVDNFDLDKGVSIKKIEIPKYSIVKISGGKVEITEYYKEEPKTTVSYSKMNYMNYETKKGGYTPIKLDLGDNPSSKMTLQSFLEVKKEVIKEEIKDLIRPSRYSIFDINNIYQETAEYLNDIHDENEKLSSKEWMSEFIEVLESLIDDFQSYYFEEERD